MVSRIEWTINAVEKYQEIIFYYKNNDALQAAFRFEETVFGKIEQLKIHTEIGRRSNRFKTIRIVKIDNFRLMSYRVKGKTLFISNFFDVRQDPKKRPF